MSANEILGWLADSALFGFVILAIGALAVRWRKQPAERLRLIEWTLVGCLIAPLVHARPGVPRWWLGISTADVDPQERPVLETSDAPASNLAEPQSRQST